MMELFQITVVDIVNESSVISEDPIILGTLPSIQGQW